MIIFKVHKINILKHLLWKIAERKDRGGLQGAGRDQRWEHLGDSLIAGALEDGVN